MSINVVESAKLMHIINNHMNNLLVPNLLSRGTSLNHKTSHLELFH